MLKDFYKKECSVKLGNFVTRNLGEVSYLGVPFQQTALKHFHYLPLPFLKPFERPY
jgi:hypothetical protein